MLSSILCIPYIIACHTYAVLASDSSRLFPIHFCRYNRYSWTKGNNVLCLNVMIKYAMVSNLKVQTFSTFSLLNQNVLHGLCVTCWCNVITRALNVMMFYLISCSLPASAISFLVICEAHKPSVSQCVNCRKCQLQHLLNVVSAAKNGGSWFHDSYNAVLSIFEPEAWRV